MANARRGAKVPRIGSDKLSFGERLKLIRERANLSYADVAARSGISSQSIARYESGL
jgi:predicted transcriptional regulator